MELIFPRKPRAMFFFGDDYITTVFLIKNWKSTKSKTTDGKFITSFLKLAHGSKR